MNHSWSAVALRRAVPNWTFHPTYPTQVRTLLGRRQCFLHEKWGNALTVPCIRHRATEEGNVNGKWTNRTGLHIAHRYSIYRWCISIPERLCGKTQKVGFGEVIKMLLEFGYRHFLENLEMKVDDSPSMRHTGCIQELNVRQIHKFHLMKVHEISGKEEIEREN